MIKFDNLSSKLLNLGTPHNPQMPLPRELFVIIKHSGHCMESFSFCLRQHKATNQNTDDERGCKVRKKRPRKLINGEIYNLTIPKACNRAVVIPDGWDLRSRGKSSLAIYPVKLKSDKPGLGSLKFLLWDLGRGVCGPFFISIF